MNDLVRELLSLVPRLGRARGFRLYAADGRRLVDLWQYGGTAILGHTPSGVLSAFKDTASRGLFAPFPHAAARRLEKSLLRLIPGRAEVRLYADEVSADSALQRAAFAGTSLRYRDFPDPAFSDPPSDAAASLWRPWVPPSAEPSPAVLAPVIPLPWPACPKAFVLDSDVASRFPPSDILSPVILTAAARAVNDLIAELSIRTQLRYKRTDAALDEGGAWVRRGIYLHRSGPCTDEEYVDLFRRFLDGGFLLPPDPGDPGVLPGELSPGEDAALAALLSEPSSRIL